MESDPAGCRPKTNDAYARGESYYKMLSAVKDVLGFDYCVPVHQGRAAEHILTKIFVRPGTVVPMNYHFTTTKAHFEFGGMSSKEIEAMAVGIREMVDYEVASGGTG